MVDHPHHHRLATTIVAVDVTIKITACRTLNGGWRTRFNMMRFADDRGCALGPRVCAPHT